MWFNPYYSSYKDVKYLADNLLLFPIEFHPEISKLYTIKTDKWSDRKEISLSPYFEKYISQVKSLLYSINEDEIYGYYLKNKPLEQYNELKGISIFITLKQILRIQIKPSIFKTIHDFFWDELIINLNNENKYFVIEILDVLKKSDKEFFSLKIDDIYEHSPASMKILYWLYDLKDKFDYNLYSYYYFTLNSVERSMFNKKAKALMGEELKQSMLRKCKPWVLMNKDEIQNIEKYSATWRSIWFLDGFIKICIDNDANFTESFPCEFSEEKFNLLSDYISAKRLNDLIIFYRNGHILKINGLNEIEEIIWKIQIQKDIESGTIRDSKNSTIKIPTNILIRNQCIQFLNQLQSNEFKAIRVLEKTFNIDSGGFSIDISLLYSFPLNTNYIAIIWESLELDKSKATHIFKCLNVTAP